jgi:hypothetical protein
MGHGLVAILLGGDFIRLEIYPDGSGIAFHTRSLYLGNIGEALVALGGPVGPSVAGSLFILSSSNHKVSRLMLLLLSVVQIISCLIWIRSFFGFIIILGFGVFIFLIALKGNDKLTRFTIQFLGVQAIASLYLSIGYLFSEGGYAAGNRFSSDTAVIARSLFFPYWFWGSVIILCSVILLFVSILTAYKSK